MNFRCVIFFYKREKVTSDSTIKQQALNTNENKQKMRAKKKEKV